MVLLASLRLAMALGLSQAAPSTTPPPAPNAPAWSPPVFPNPSPRLPPGQEPNEPLPRGPTENSWADVAHEFVETRLFSPVLRLDRIFGSDEPEFEEERSRSFIVWRNELRFDSERHPSYTLGLHASLNFPSFNRIINRIRIVVVGQTQRAIDALVPEETAQGSPYVGSPGAEARFSLYETVRSHVEIGAGVLLQWPLGVFSRVGFHLIQPIGELFVLRLSGAGFWRTDTHLGWNAGVRMERPIYDLAILRVVNEFLYTQRTTAWPGAIGLEWSPDLEAVFRLGTRSSATFRLGALSSAKERPQVDRYILGLRLRRDFYRQWLFLELEPEFYWPYSVELGRHAAWAVTLRLEVQFHGNLPRPVSNPPPESPPTDPEPEQRQPEG